MPQLSQQLQHSNLNWRHSNTRIQQPQEYEPNFNDTYQEPIAANGAFGGMFMDHRGNQ